MSHTPGPWYAKDGMIASETDPSGKTIATCPDDANAHLIAAAPALLTALKDLLPTCDATSHTECQWCGRSLHYSDGSKRTFTFCPSDDCPGYTARQAVALATGQPGGRDA